MRFHKWVYKISRSGGPLAQRRSDTINLPLHDALAWALTFRNVSHECVCVRPPLVLTRTQIPAVYKCTYTFQCKELLDLLGIPHLQSLGEAEALCALLNKEEVSSHHFTVVPVLLWPFARAYGIWFRVLTVHNLCLSFRKLFVRKLFVPIYVLWRDDFGEIKGQFRAFFAIIQCRNEVHIHNSCLCSTVRYSPIFVGAVAFAPPLYVSFHGLGLPCFMSVVCTLPRHHHLLVINRSVCSFQWAVSMEGFKCH